jgi:hypothetical protein
MTEDDAELLLIVMEGVETAGEEPGLPLMDS